MAQMGYSKTDRTDEHLRAADPRHVPGGAAD
jgi:hypothetical protein